MSKKLIATGLESCKACPAFWESDDDRGGMYQGCTMKPTPDLVTPFIDTSKIPDWCPLPDEE